MRSRFARSIGGRRDALSASVSALRPDMGHALSDLRRALLRGVDVGRLLVARLETIARAAEGSMSELSDEPDVMFIADLAQALRTSTRTIKRRLRSGADLPEQMKRVDRRPRWLRTTVEAWKARGDHAEQSSRFRAVRGGRR